MSYTESRYTAPTIKLVPMTSRQRTIIYSTNPLHVHECGGGGVSFILRYPNSTATDIMVHGLPEQSLIDWCRQFCRPDGIFIDIGAHCGMYALSLAKHCKTVHAFECQRETYYQLCGGVALNAAWNVYPHHVALGDRSVPEVTMNIVSLDGGGTSIVVNGEAPEHDTVEMKTLDAVELPTNICFLKLDVEGAEEMVLRGARQTLERSNYPPFIFESWVNDTARTDSLHNYIVRDLGYDLVPLVGYPYMMLAVNKKHHP